MTRGTAALAGVLALGLALGVAPAFAEDAPVAPDAVHCDDHGKDGCFWAKLGSVGELGVGVGLSFTGFLPEETATGDVQVMDQATHEWTSIGTFAAVLGPDGSGNGIFTITGATGGDRFRVIVNGEAGSVTQLHPGSGQCHRHDARG